MNNLSFQDLFKHTGKDLQSGVVVFLVALPLCLGIALASGAPLFSGLLAGIVGGIVVGTFSKSHTSVSGPAAGLTIIVLTAIADLKSFEVFLLAVSLAGIMQIVLGFAKAGLIALFFPNAVIKGMLSAIGIILILKQLPHFMGVDIEAFGSLEFFDPKNNMNTFEELMYAIGHIHEGPLIIGAVSLVLLVIFELKAVKKIPIFKIIPGPLIVVVLGVVLKIAFDSIPMLFVEESHLVAIPSLLDANSFIAFFSTPKFSAISTFEVWRVAFLIAIIASLETLLSIEAVDKLDPHRRHTPPNAELKAQGIGNVISGLIGGLPVTSVIVRSSANIDSGGQTKLSAVYHGIFLIISVVAIPHILNLIPLSCLAAVLLLVGFKLAKPALFKEQHKKGLDQFLPFVITISAILFTDLLIGILIGLGVGVFFILKANYANPYVYNEEFDEEGRKLIHIKLSEHVSFINKASLQLTLDEIPKGCHVVIDGSISQKIDNDALALMKDFKVQALENDIQLELINVNLEN